MKKTLIAAIVVVVFVSISLYAQTTQTTQAASNKQQNVTNIQDNSLQQGTQLQNQSLVDKNRYYRNTCPEVCDGTQKRLNKQINRRECEGSGKRNYKRGRR